jgi:hypothetical protein
LRPCRQDSTKSQASCGRRDGLPGATRTCCRHVRSRTGQCRTQPGITSHAARILLGESWSVPVTPGRYRGGMGTRRGRAMIGCSMCAPPVSATAADTGGHGRALLAAPGYPLAGKLGPHALLAQGIEHRFPNLTLVDRLQASDLLIRNLRLRSRVAFASILLGGSVVVGGARSSTTRCEEPRSTSPRTHGCAALFQPAVVARRGDAQTRSSSATICWSMVFVDRPYHRRQVRRHGCQ